jgi:2-keto-3-deoxy-6-phosphogluconate aldolase
MSMPTAIGVNGIHRAMLGSDYGIEAVEAFPSGRCLPMDPQRV